MKCERRGILPYSGIFRSAIYDLQIAKKLKTNKQEAERKEAMFRKMNAAPVGARADGGAGAGGEDEDGAAPAAEAVPTKSRRK